MLVLPLCLDPNNRHFSGSKRFFAFNIHVIYRQKKYCIPVLHRFKINLNTTYLCMCLFCRIVSCSGTPIYIILTSTVINSGSSGRLRGGVQET